MFYEPSIVSSFWKVTPNEFDAVVSGTISLSPQTLSLEFDLPPLHASTGLTNADGSSYSETHEESLGLGKEGHTNMPYLNYVEQDDGRIFLLSLERQELLDPSGYLFTLNANGSIMLETWFEVSEYILGTEILRNGAAIDLNKGARIYAGDVIVTGSGSWLKISCRDGSNLVIGQNTRLEATELFETLSVKSFIMLIYGRIWVSLKATNKLEVITLTLVTSRRGTEFSLEVAANGTTTLLVLEGEVELSDLNRTKTVLVGKYQTSVTDSNGLPSDPVTIDEGKIEKWWASITPTPTPMPTPSPTPAPTTGQGFPLEWIAAIAIIVVVVAAIALWMKRRK